ncbi:MAG: dUTPase [Cetobacterium sp.]
MGRPNNIFELLKLQKELDKKTSAERINGFKPRKRDAFDLTMALDDEFNEFMKELPDELNFKYWKDKKHNPHKQLIEYADCLFFIAGAINDFHSKKSGLIARIDLMFKDFEKSETELNKGLLSQFKYTLGSIDLEDEYEIIVLTEFYLEIGSAAGYTSENIFDAYWEKWNINMGRDKKDWTLGGE